MNFKGKLHDYNNKPTNTFVHISSFASGFESSTEASPKLTLFSPPYYTVFFDFTKEDS